MPAPTGECGSGFVGSVHPSRPRTRERRHRRRSTLGVGAVRRASQRAARATAGPASPAADLGPLTKMRPRASPTVAVTLRPSTAPWYGIGREGSGRAAARRCRSAGVTTRAVARSTPGTFTPTHGLRPISSSSTAVRIDGRQRGVAPGNHGAFVRMGDNPDPVWDWVRVQFNPVRCRARASPRSAKLEPEPYHRHDARARWLGTQGAGRSPEPRTPNWWHPVWPSDAGLAQHGWLGAG